MGYITIAAVLTPSEHALLRAEVERINGRLDSKIPEAAIAGCLLGIALTDRAAVAARERPTGRAAA